MEELQALKRWPAEEACCGSSGSQGAKLAGVPTSKTAKMQRVVPMARMGAEMLTQLGEELATKQELKVRRHLECNSLGVGSGVISERAILVEDRSIRAAGPETLLHHHNRVHLAISTLHRPPLLGLLLEDQKIVEATLPRMVAGGLRLAHPRPSLALAAGLDWRAPGPRDRWDRALAGPAASLLSWGLIHLGLALLL